MKKIQIVIVLSLILNMVLGGMLIGMKMHDRPHSPMTTLKVWGKNELPAEKQQAFNVMMQKLDTDTHDLRQQVKEARREMHRQLAAETYDKAAYLKAVDNFQKLMKAQMRQFAGSVADFATQLTPEERASLVKMLSRRPPPPGEKPAEQKPGSSEPAKSEAH
ncbi:MAG: periplasmic heavy metal sensor [Rickettsiales bacterium]